MKGNFHLRFAYKQTSNKTMLLLLHGIFPFLCPATNALQIETISEIFDINQAISLPTGAKKKGSSVMLRLPRRRSVEERAVIFLARYWRHCCCWHISKLLLTDESRFV